jgi:hypothetical protein
VPVAESSHPELTDIKQIMYASFRILTLKFMGNSPPNCGKEIYALIDLIESRGAWRIDRLTSRPSQCGYRVDIPEVPDM